ncbi:hypothetical protein V8E54_012355 [Elaphomyces granulatus]
MSRQTVLITSSPCSCKFPLDPNSKLQPADLQLADLQPADLQPADLQPADLQPTDLQPTDLQPVDLQQADLLHALKSLQSPVPLQALDPHVSAAAAPPTSHEPSRRHRCAEWDHFDRRDLATGFRRDHPSRCPSAEVSTYPGGFLGLGCFLDCLEVPTKTGKVTTKTG